MKSSKLFVSAILFFLIATSTSCLEKVEEQEAALGKEAIDGDVQKAIDDATSGISMLDTVVGNYVDYEYNARIEQSSVYRLGKIDRALLSIKETSEAYTFVYYENFYEFELSGALKDEWHKEQTLQLAKRFDSLTTNMLQPKNEFACDGKDDTDKDGDTYDCIKYFNLKYTLRRLPAPAAVKSRPNCLGLEDCKLNVRHLAYDEVKWRKGKAVSKLEYKINITPEVPHLFPESGLPPVLDLCVREINDFGDRKNVLVTSCRVLRDMKF